MTIPDIGTRPCALSATAAAAAIARGELTSVELVESLLERAAGRDEVVGAWAFLDRESVLGQARAADRFAPKGPLHGVPVGLADVIDAYDMPTGSNSPIRPDYRPIADAAVAAMIRRSGGLIMGKTATTWFADRHPGRTRNPHDPERKPGGSSGGSAAAAVADRQVPLSIGTQTSGSVVRSAAFCGIVGYKPSFGEISRVGVRQQSGTLDTIGLCGRDVADIELLRAVLVGIPHAPVEAASGQTVIAICRPPEWGEASDYSRERVEEAARRLEAAGAKLVECALPDDPFRGWLDDHRRIAGFEASRNFAFEKHNHPEAISQSVYEGRIRDGERCSVADYIAAQRRTEAMRAWYENATEGVGAVLTLSAAGEAPIGHADTGSAAFNALWTMLYAPCLTLPAGIGPSGMPIGVQLVGRRFEDERLFAVSRFAERAIAGI